MNHAQLKAAIASWLKRSDLATSIPTFIELAEARISRELRLRSQVTFTTLTANSGSAPLPADFLEFKALVYADDATPIQVGTLEQVFSDRARISGYRPKFCMVTGDAIQFGPAADSSYSIAAAYYAKFAALSTDGDTNWLLTNHPGVYLWASLAEAAPWMLNDERLAVWEGKYAQDKQALETADRNAEFGGTGLEAFPLNTQQVV
jgi:hypothetical protein